MQTLRLACFFLALAGALLGQAPSLSNLSTRAQVGTGGDIMITGFNIGAGSNKTVLIRATGPALTAFGVAGALADPKLELYNGATKVSENDNWGTPVGGATAVTAATFSSVAAFPLAAGSRDSALLATLAPGSYTAQVTGINNTTGVALIEVYEVGAAAARLTNISTRALVGTGSDILIPGLVISPGNGTRRLLIRAAGPSLGALGVSGALADPTMVVLGAGGVTVASNDNWGTPAGSGAASATALAAAFTQAAAFSFAAGSRDAAVLADFAPGNYTIQVAGVNNTTGVALVEVYDVTPVGGATVTLRATKPQANESGTLAGEFVVTRNGDTLNALTVNYGVSGSATNGLDYPLLPGFVIIPAGATTATIALQPLADTAQESPETVTLTLAAGAGYTLGNETSGTVTIADNPASLFVASLRPGAGAGSSAASGLATIILSADGSMATVNVAFSNLSSGQVGAHLFLGNSTSTGDYVLNLPLGQVGGIPWSIQPTASYNSAQIIDALRKGLIYVGIDTGNFPAGELRGAFIAGIGSQTFTAPAPAPAVALNNLTATDAARLLTQASFGPTKSEIDALAGGSVETWITQQIALPAGSLRDASLAEFNAAKADTVAAGGNPNDLNFSFAMRRRAWFPVALAGRDQLRQRVAFALSQILVVSDTTLALALNEGVANYWDTLARGAFGNFRTLLEQATLSPVMGTYLSHLRNAKADPVTDTSPDENYAREVMQLFTIGLVQLQPDGTLKLDAQGLPIPTYNQTTITETAKILTGFGFYSLTPTTATFRTTRADYLNPMSLYSGYHETSQKIIVGNTSPNGTVIPANLSGTEDLKRLLDTLYNHPNTAPFICRQLIQRMVTDNPSPAYVYRVAQVFDQQRTSSTQLGSVVRAILTDYEARATTAAAAPGYGKLREPLLRFTGLLRGFNATTPSGRNILEGLGNATFQAAQQAPSVFNFFEPRYVYPGPLAAAGLVAPEFQITDATSSITLPNLLYNYTVSPTASTGRNFDSIYALNLDAELALAGNLSALLDRLSAILCAGQMTAATKTRITAAIEAMPAASTTALERVRHAIYLLVTSPDGSIQR